MTLFELENSIPISIRVTYSCFYFLRNVERNYLQIQLPTNSAIKNRYAKIHTHKLLSYQYILEALG